MPQIPFEKLPDHGRLWVFPATRRLQAEESSALLGAVDDFLADWAAHGAPLRSARVLRDDQFLLVGVDVDAESPSGCSIDALVNRLRALGSELGVSLIDHAWVWYRAGGAVRCASRAEFRRLAEEGAVTADGMVFDTSLTTVSQARDGSLERPAHGSWHGRAFFGRVRA